MARRVRPRCAAYDVAWWQWGQGRCEGWVSKAGRGEKVFGCAALEGTREYKAWGRGGEEGRVHTFSGGLWQWGDEGRAGGKLKAGLLVGFTIFVYIYTISNSPSGRAAWYACAAFSV